MLKTYISDKVIYISHIIVISLHPVYLNVKYSVSGRFREVNLNFPIPADYKNVQRNVHRGAGHLQHRP